MIYSNVKLKSEEREFDFGKINQISVGESGRGRKIIALTCPDETVLAENEINNTYSIGTTKSGKPRIVKANDSEVYLILSSQGGYTCRGDGRIFSLKSQKENFKVLVSGNGADGAAGRIGTWDCFLIKIVDPNKSALIRVRTSGGGYGTPNDYYYYDSTTGKIHHATDNNVDALFDTLDIKPLFKFEDDKFTFEGEDGWEVF